MQDPETKKDQGITVGVNGRRFYMDRDADVAENWDTFTERDLRVHVGSRHGHMQFGGERPRLPMPAKTWFVTDAPGYQSILENKMMGIELDPTDGWGHTADTVEAPAELIDVPSDELARTVDASIALSTTTRCRGKALAYLIFPAIFAVFGTMPDSMARAANTLLLGTSSAVMLPFLAKLCRSNALRLPSSVNYLRKSIRPICTTRLQNRDATCRRPYSPKERSTFTRASSGR